MGLLCKLGFHSWSGCKCSRCEKTRNEGHDWGKDCETCARCDTRREGTHSWSGCKCSRCGAIRITGHVWSGAGSATCSRCGSEKSAIMDVCRTAGHRWSSPPFSECTVCGIRLKELQTSALAEVALSYPDDEVRRWAVTEMKDQTTLSKVALTDRASIVRSRAVSNLTDQALLGRIAVDDGDEKVRSTASEYLSDQAMLTKVALGDPSEMVRRIAIRKLTDQALLVQIAVAEKEGWVRDEAVAAVTEPALLARLCSLGVHKWTGCRCQLCGGMRDDEHTLVDSCKCVSCGKFTNEGHRWRDSQACSTCGRSSDEAVAVFKRGVALLDAPPGEGNLIQAMQCFMDAAKQGLMEAQLNVAVGYEKGSGLEKNKVFAVKWYGKAADRGHLEARYRQGALLIDDFMPTAWANGVTYLRMAADLGHAGAQCDLGACYGDGKGVEKDPETALAWFRKAADQGDASAQFNIGIAYENGAGVTRDLSEAARWFRRAADLGHPLAKQRV